MNFVFKTKITKTRTKESLKWAGQSTSVEKNWRSVAVCLSISVYFTPLKGELQNRLFRRVFALDQRTLKQVFSSITKILRWFDMRNYEKRTFWFKYRAQFLRFWQLFLLKWLQSLFSWGQVLMKHWEQFLSVLPSRGVYNISMLVDDHILSNWSKSKSFVIQWKWNSLQQAFE